MDISHIVLSYAETTLHTNSLEVVAKFSLISKVYFPGLLQLHMCIHFIYLSFTLPYIHIMWHGVTSLNFLFIKQQHFVWCSTPAFIAKFMDTCYVWKYSLGKYIVKFSLDAVNTVIQEYTFNCILNHIHLQWLPHAVVQHHWSLIH